jgi:hypothetical protein
MFNSEKYIDHMNYLDHIEDKHSLKEHDHRSRHYAKRGIDCLQLFLA